MTTAAASFLAQAAAAVVDRSISAPLYHNISNSASHAVRRSYSDSAMGWKDYDLVDRNFQEGVEEEIADAAAKADTTFLAQAKASRTDWLLVLLAVVVVAVLELVPPFERYTNQYEIQHFKYPLKGETVPSAILPVAAVIVPLFVLVVLSAGSSRRAVLHHSILGLLTAVAVAMLVTNVVKVAAGRLRPSFFHRCFSDGVAAFKDDGNVSCSGKQAVIREGRKSFPSGHSSLAFSGLGYLSLFLAAHLRVFTPPPRFHVAPLLLAAVPLALAVFVAVSRVTDYWHWPTDVVAGSALGLGAALAVFRAHFAWPWAKRAGPQSGWESGHQVVDIISSQA